MVFVLRSIWWLEPDSKTIPIGGVSVGELAPKRFQDPQIQSFWMTLGSLTSVFFNGDFLQILPW